ncbi:MAG: hypothetical protein ABIN61_07865 [candidate division WOR-3 bacterium]
MIYVLKKKGLEGLKGPRKAFSDSQEEKKDVEDSVVLLRKQS